MKWYEHVYSTWLAMKECERRNNEVWYKRHSKTIYKLLDLLPHGSGLDGQYKLDVKNEKILLYMDYHAMDDNGYYDGWIHFTVTITPSLFYGCKIRITGNFGKYQSIKEYLYDIYDDVLSRELEERWRITSIENHEDGKPLYWSNDMGWVDSKSATIFNAEESRTLNLPTSGMWEFVEYSLKN